MMFTQGSKELKKYLKQDLTDSAPTAGRLVQKITVKMVGVGVSIDWVHPKSMQNGIVNEATYELLDYGHLQPVGFLLQFKQDSESGIWSTKLVDQK